ncbi:MAG: 50S ribosomal protein L29 [Anaerolineaceae bacterium]|nr:MAG: 50S ribosomal protein L29 [Anaerolineaceae bacterium]
MANIVELREMSDDKLEEMLENAREEMFNLRFQQATAQLDNHARVKIVRREIAQVETVLYMRRLAIEAAATEPTIATALSDKEWRANAHFDYEDSAWQVEFSDEDGNDVASALVNLNKKRSRVRKGRASNRPLQLVVSYEVAG